jgi:cellulose synthase/poly-beta-1,6-N-acetylglucosamine synthase-like glycosyltransferase
MLLICISLSVALVYAILIFVFAKGWDKTALFTAEPESVPDPWLSVVVACRNEALQLPSLLLALQNQSIRNFELILVNDNSSDDTSVVMESAKSSFNNITIVDCKGNGKKQALKAGIQVASGELIVTTDADCRPHPEWIATICSFMHRHPTDLLIGPVNTHRPNSFREKLQQLEFVTLVASGAGAAGAGLPIMCNGGNLVFTKKAWLESQTDLHEEQISGDDVFLLLSIKKRKGTIRFLKSEKAMVTTAVAPDLKSFVRQRMRWTSKAPAYTDFHLILTALSVFGISVVQLALLFLPFLSVQYFIGFLTVFCIKLLIDFIFCMKIKDFFSLQLSPQLLLSLSFLYPFYITTVVVLTARSRKKKW